MAKSSKKFGISFDGFDTVLDRLKKMDADIKGVTERALIETHGYITPTLHELMKSHERTGTTEKSIVDTAKVVWTGDKATIDVGFDIANGGLASVFLMYGTPRHGPGDNKGVKVDKKLHDAVFGNATANKIHEIQSDIFYAEIRRLNG